MVYEEKDLMKAVVSARAFITAQPTESWRTQSDFDFFKSVVQFAIDEQKKTATGPNLTANLSFGKPTVIQRPHVHKFADGVCPCGVKEA